MCDFDKASDLEQFQRDQALEQRKPEGPKACGFCWSCEEPLSAGLRFCDALCRDEWEDEQSRRHQQ